MSNNLPFNNAALQDGLHLFMIHPEYDCVNQLVLQKDKPGKEMDTVHEFGEESVEALRTYRVGGHGRDKVCWGVKDSQGNIHAVIYLLKTKGLIRTPGDLAGDAEAILHAPIKEFNGIPSSVIFYSINRITERKGAGKDLLLQLYARLRLMYGTENTIFSTLTPKRQPGNGHTQLGIDDFIDARGDEWARRGDAGKKALGLEYLRLGIEGVERFHLGNGAIIGDIKLNADTMGKYRIMVNCIYPPEPEELNANAALFKKFKEEGGALPSALVHPWLLEETASFNPANESRAQAAPVSVAPAPSSAGMHIAGPV